MQDRCWSSAQSSLVKHHFKQARHALHVAALHRVVTKAVGKRHKKLSSFTWGIVESETMRRTPISSYPSHLDGMDNCNNLNYSWALGSLGPAPNLSSDCSTIVYDVWTSRPQGCRAKLESMCFTCPQGCYSIDLNYSLHLTAQGVHRTAQICSMCSDTAVFRAQKGFTRISERSFPLSWEMSSIRNGQRLLTFKVV
jgi:hypothetical protein